MPAEGSLVEFKNHNRSIRVPFIIYADFESLIKPISGAEPKDNKSFTRKYQKHKPCGFCYQIASFDEELYYQESVIYRSNSGDEEFSQDVAQIFVERLEENIRKIHKEFDFAKKRRR